MGGKPTAPESWLRELRSGTKSCQSGGLRNKEADMSKNKIQIDLAKLIRGFHVTRLITPATGFSWAMHLQLAQWTIKSVFTLFLFHVLFFFLVWDFSVTNCPKTTLTPCLRMPSSLLCVVFIGLWGVVVVFLLLLLLRYRFSLDRVWFDHKRFLTWGTRSLIGCGTESWCVCFHSIPCISNILRFRNSYVHALFSFWFFLLLSPEWYLRPTL